MEDQWRMNAIVQHVTLVHVYHILKALIVTLIHDITQEIPVFHLLLKQLSTAKQIIKQHLEHGQILMENMLEITAAHGDQTCILHALVHHIHNLVHLPRTHTLHVSVKHVILHIFL